MSPVWPQDRFDPSAFMKMAPAVQERIATLSEAPAMVDFLFLPDPLLDESSWQKIAKDSITPEILQRAMRRYEACKWESDVLHEQTRELGEEVGLKLAKVQAPIRVAVTGRTVGPPLFESLELLGRSEVLRRVQGAIDRLG